MQVRSLPPSSCCSRILVAGIIAAVTFCASRSFLSAANHRMGVGGPPRPTGYPPPPPPPPINQPTKPLRNKSVLLILSMRQVWLRNSHLASLAS
jgi:hypothetical protein